MTTRKASYVLLGLYNSACLSEHIKPGYPPIRMTDAQADLCKDLMELLPEKVSNHTRSYGDGWNEAIDQTEQAIKAYFGQGE